MRIGPLTRELPSHGLAPGPARVALRPETIQLSPERRADALAGEVLKATYLGSHMEYTVTTPLGELFVVDPHVDRALPPGYRGLGPPRRPRPHARAGLSRAAAPLSGGELASTQASWKPISRASG